MGNETSCHPEPAKDLGDTGFKILCKLRMTDVFITYYVYIVANWNNKVVYTGMTNNLERRIYERKRRFDGERN